MRSFIIVFFLSLSTTIFAQNNKEKLPYYFGFQVKPILPGFLIGTTSFDANVNGFNNHVKQEVGYSFGGVVRLGVTKFIAIETGINFNQRKYSFESSVPDSSAFAGAKLRYVTYDIPVSALFYIRLSERFYTNVAIGAALSYNPTAIGRRVALDGYHEFIQLGIGKKVIAEAIANIGFEFRSEKSGIFYLGAAARVPFGPLFYLKSTYRYQGFSVATDPNVQGRVDGSYISLEFRYFFHNIKSKGSPIKTPL